MNGQTISQPTSEQIAAAAYLIWENEGRPHGRHQVHWFQAEKQLRADRLHDAGALLRPEPAVLAKPAPSAKPPGASHWKAKHAEVVAR
jgi:hypothetical protein